jgi:3-isopropylmalate/(R)-2-methylmalate dehydratase small subunit
MKPFVRETGIAAPMLVPNINTDLIAPILLPGRSPAEAARMSLADRMFANLRYDETGSDQPDFVLNRPEYRHPLFLLAGPNFGCGSSREIAVWALLEFGIRAVIAPSFAEIFRENAYQSGLLPVELPLGEIERIAGRAPEPLVVDLEAQQVVAANQDPVAFRIPDNRRRMLLRGIDQLGLILEFDDTITAFEEHERTALPWTATNTAILHAL